ncbi:MAG: MrtC family glutamic-type intramembrane protease [Polyangiaceae bacterium]|nr:MrtC family glutamic-type intramembrane protease [Polyangiaceae bacterium]
MTTLLVAGLSYALPPSWAGTGVGMAFFGAVYFLVLRNPNEDPRKFGLALGGLLEAEPLQASKLLREGAEALAWAAIAGAIVFPFYWFGYLWWWHPSRSFDFTRLPSLNDAFGQILAVALPEEAFYRGYLQSELTRKLPAKWQGAARLGPWAQREGLDQPDTRGMWFGARFFVAALLTSGIFALGHFATEPQPYRLAVFFPSLLFGWLRAKTNGIGASVLFHASCNLFSLYLAQGYGFIQ